jgi:hypothetical protein
MKVHELIEVLSCLDPDLRVGVVATDPRIVDGDTSHAEIVDLRIDSAEPRVRVGLQTEMSLYYAG